MAKKTPRPDDGLRQVEEIAEGLWIILMFDHLIAAFKKLDDDSGVYAEEIAGLETAKADFAAKQAADEQALAALQAKVDALAAPIDTSSFASAADLKALQDAVAALPPAPDLSALATKADVDALTKQLSDLDAEVGALGNEPGVPGVPGVPDGPVPFSVSPTSVTFGAGAPSTEALTIAGGTPPYLASGLPGGVTFIDSGLDGDATTEAGSTDATISDSANPPASATVTVVVTAAPEPAPAP